MSVVRYRYEIRSGREVIGTGENVRPEFQDQDHKALRKLLDAIEGAHEEPSGAQCEVRIWAGDEANPRHVHVYDAP